MNIYNTSSIYLQSDDTGIDFVAAYSPSNAYVLLEQSLNMEHPESEDMRISTTYGGNPIRDMRYTTRKITFDFMVVGSSDKDVATKVESLSVIFSKIISKLYLDGGAYNSPSEYANSPRKFLDVGEGNVALQIRIGTSSEITQITRENGNLDFYEHTYATRVLVARLIPTEDFASSTRKMTISGQAKYVRSYKMELECEPYFSMQPMSIISGNAGLEIPNGANAITFPTLKGADVYPYSGTTIADVNRILIAPYNVHGTEPAPTRISTTVNGGTGILIARDAGISVLNAPSVPVYTGSSGKDNLFVTGQYLAMEANNTPAARKIIVEITSTSPDTYKYSVNGGASYTTGINMTTTPVNTILTSDASKFGSGLDGIKIQFKGLTGHAVGDKWEFYTHQSYVKTPMSTRNVYTDRQYAYDEDGMVLTAKAITVPYKCRSRYKVYIHFDKAGGFIPEFSMATGYGGYASSYSSKLYSGFSKYDWVMPGGTSSFVDLGILDFTASGTPGLAHPYVSSELMITFYMRSTNDVPVGSTMLINGFYLVPCQDDNSWFHAAWTDDGAERETFCNYDQLNPYMIETEPPSNTDIVHAMPLNGTYGGGFITLIPNQINTLLMLPIFSTDTDWRKSTLSIGGTLDYTRIAYKPRFVTI